ncbi:phosphoribosyltransferase [Catenulispora acidiphila DSM 44928]|uniref:Phosphoribosyltransferase n=1 Tax=Catenulispora acidiphila (strain DSM 44928 / JCM 14897 / NBRC 102108 / NRRL B-24433 / ID139908) TaxID=479433 RepID=C7Q413_CATAD|nr:phosphoribosyltransferase [Catenulispora acidiphila]ACU77771.1 phosphoribosyltransferase [Catenulispora acidiphila DSM 44928]
MRLTTDSTALIGALKVARLGPDGTARPDRIVHALDGLCEPVDVTDLADVALHLWRTCREQLDQSGTAPDYLLGLDAGGIVPALALAQTSGIPFKIAWKLQLELPDAIHFTEPHSSRPDMYAYAIEAGAQILLVDDEITTGRTLASLAEALRAAGAVPVAAACLIEDVRHGGRELLAEQGVPLVSLLKLT